MKTTDNNAEQSVQKWFTEKEGLSRPPPFQ